MSVANFEVCSFCLVTIFIDHCWESGEGNASVDLASILTVLDNPRWVIFKTVG